MAPKIGDNMNWESYVKKLVPYVAGEQPKRDKLIKLNTNENPYPPAPGVRKILNEMEVDGLRKYPDPNISDLTKALAKELNVEEDEMFIGVGSDDVISMIYMTFFHSDKPLLFPDVTYSFYDVWAELHNVKYEQIPLDENWHIVASDYKRENGGIIFPNPNAPTGLYESLDLVREIIEANRDSVVVVDEAYIDFGGQSALPLIREYDNLIVVQTYSKSRSLAGLRVGYACANKKLIKYLQDVKFSFNSYTLNAPSQVVALESVKDRAYFEECCKKIINTRENAKLELKKMGFSFPDSKANFIFASHESVPAKYIFEELRARDIFVRYWNKDRINNSLRITVGTDAEMESLFAALKEIINNY